MESHIFKSPHDKASILSRSCLLWLFPIVRNTPKDVDEEKLTALPNSIDIEKSYERLKAKWEEEKAKKNPRFYMALLRSEKFYFLFLMAMILLVHVLPLVGALIIGFIVDYLYDEDREIWYGLILAFLLFLCYLVINTALDHFIFWGTVFGAMVKLLGIQLIYDKVFKLDNSALNGEQGAGKIVTLAAKDLEAYDKIYLPCMVVSFLPVVGLSAGLLWWKLGLAGIIALSVSLLFIPMQFWFSYMFSVIWDGFSSATDRRVNLISDIIEGIKVIKLYHWETPYQEMNQEVREKEISYIRRASYFRVSSYSLFLCGQGLLLAVAFSIYVSLGNELTFSEVFVGIAVLSHAHQYLSSIFGLSMEYTGIAIGASKRITESLMLPEKQNKGISYTDKPFIKIVNMDVSWRPELPQKPNTEDQPLLETEEEKTIVLQGINLEVEEGKLCVVLGKVGSGKTSLLYSLLGELHIQSGSIEIGEKIAYVEQEPWILSASIRDNIVMNLLFDDEKYAKTVEVCCLSEDFREMAYGDQTMIGDKGINLSGGQKARIALARAVYTEGNIYLLDDPLSAVDAIVSSDLFTRCINGHLRGKTRVLVTHQQFVLPEADVIVLLGEGCITFKGSYEEFLKYSENAQERELQYEHEAEAKEIQTVSKSKDHLSIITEEKDSGDIPIKIYLDFFLESFRTILNILIYVLFCLAVQSLFVIIQVWISYWTGQTESEQGEPYYYEILLTMVGVLFVGTFLRNLLFIQTLLTSCEKVYNKALNGTMRTNAQFFDANPSGRIINRFSRDTYIMDDVMTVFIIDGVQLGLVFLGYIVASMIFVPYNIITVVIFFAIVVKLKQIITPAARELKRIELVTRSPLFNWLNAGVNGIVQVRCFGWNDYFSENLREAAAHSMRASFHFLAQSRLFLYSVDLSLCFFSLINALLIVAWLGPDDPDTGSLALIFGLSMVSIISNIGRDWLDTDVGMTSVQRLYEYSNLPLEEEPGKPDLVLSEGKLTFSNVVMRYREHLDPALKGLTFEAFPRQKIGIVGRTGAGKSSIFQTLFRLVPIEEGSITIDNQDISQVNLGSLRLQLGIIPQNPFVFYASLRKNLDPYDQYTDEDIWKALKKVELDTIFENEYLGLYTLISASTCSLSLGQRQLLCLARMLLRRNKILVLDEATANVDNKTDELIQSKVREFFYASTVVCIAHRINTVIDSHQIIVMDKGTVGESGHPYELLQNPSSHFTALVNELGTEESQKLIQIAQENYKK